MAVASFVLSCIAILISWLAFGESKKQTGLTEKGQKSEETRWLAEKRPAITVTFPDAWRDPTTDRLEFSKRNAKGPMLIQLENKGKLACTFKGFWLEDKPLKGELLPSGDSSDRVAGFLGITTLIPDESQVFKSEQLNQMAKQADKDWPLLKFIYRFGDNREATVELPLAPEWPDGPQGHVNLVALDCYMNYSEKQVDDQDA